MDRWMDEVISERLSTYAQLDRQIRSKPYTGEPLRQAPITIREAAHIVIVLNGQQTKSTDEYHGIILFTSQRSTRRSGAS